MAKYENMQTVSTIWGIEEGLARLENDLVKIHFTAVSLQVRPCCDGKRAKAKYESILKKLRKLGFEILIPDREADDG